MHYFRLCNWKIITEQSVSEQVVCGSPKHTINLLTSCKKLSVKGKQFYDTRAKADCVQSVPKIVGHFFHECFLEHAA